jgi:hypothetical protein
MSSPTRTAAARSSRANEQDGEPAREVPVTAFAGARINGAILNGLAKLSDRQEQISLRARLRRERVEAIRSVAARGEDPLGALAEVAVGLAVGFMLEGSGLYAELEPVRPAGAVVAFRSQGRWRALRWPCRGRPATPMPTTSLTCF